MKISITSLSELKSTFDKLIDEDAIFRGINDRDQMLPKLIRTNTNCASKETKILRTFEQYYGIYSTANNCWEFLALAQHCGLMTRLIDFTYNPYVALFFSLYQQSPSETYEIWVIRKKDMTTIFDSVSGAFSIDEKTGTLNINESAFNSGQSYSTILSNEFKNLKNKKGIITIRPNYRNSRMLMQQGLFVVPNKISKEAIMNKFENKADVIMIDKSIRIKALNYLKSIGFNEFRLMPDIDSLCYEINHSIIENNK